ncbi:vacuolar protein sorting-associated protein 60.1-like isoform X4 [Camellia sinensis]|uniref:vacuolar protein sorting-associated protein 60.1-like isoform X4 n=1 Tax=Camellia sinensis TaxID=4442 RepID=UPI001036D09C|nr:vacuolar protein sorting-associated protein 60.1-like isoform X4 [Camellia sinensis]
MKFKSLLVEAMMYLITVSDEEELMGGKLIYCIINFFVEEEICYLVCFQKYLDALEADVGMETEGDGVPAYLHPDLEGGAHLATSTNRACSTSSTS